MRDLCPDIIRQRLIVEWIVDHNITEEQIKKYLVRIGEITQMIILTDPVTHKSDKYGRSWWVHRETSGAHFYARTQPHKFFSVDMYTCKAFDPEAIVKFTKEYFKTLEIEYKEV